MPPTLFAIGHEKASQGDVLATLIVTHRYRRPLEYHRSPVTLRSHGRL